MLKNESLCEILCNDRSTNIPNPPEVSSRLPITQTGGLEKKLMIKKNAPIVITSNHNVAKYKEDGIVNGARGYVQSIQVSKENQVKVEIVWVVFNKLQQFYQCVNIF